MLLEALIERARSLCDVPSGYAKTTVTNVLRIAADGRFLGLEELETPREIIVPSTKRTSGVKANTAVDDFIYALGAGGPGRDAEWVAVRNDAYREVLQGIEHPAARAVIAFLDRNDRPLIVPMGAQLTDAQFGIVSAAEPVEAEDPKKLPPLVTRGVLTTDPVALGIYRRARANAEMYHPNPTGVQVIHTAADSKALLLVEVEGYPNWWASPAVASAHRARLAESNASGGAKPSKSDVLEWGCSLCGERKTLARLFRPSSRFRAALVSFNASAWSGYGLSQGHNAPTCTDCAEGIAVGLDDLASRDGFLRRWSDDGHLIWWASDPNAPAPWPLLDAAINPSSTEAEREAALAQIQDGHFASLEKSMGRLALRRYAPVDAEAVRRVVRKWNALVTPHMRTEAGKAHPIWLMSGALTLRPGTRKTDPERDHLTELLYEALVAGETLPPRVTSPVRRHLQKHVLERGTFTNVRLAAFLAFADAPMPEEIPVTATKFTTDPLPEEGRLSDPLRGAFNFGRAFARLDYLQHARGSTQRSIQVTHFEQVLRTPSKTLGDLMGQLGHRRGTDKDVQDTLAMAFYKSGLDLLMFNGGATRFTTEQKDAFRLGFMRQVEIQRAVSRARRDQASDTTASSTAS